FFRDSSEWPSSWKFACTHICQRPGPMNSLSSTRFSLVPKRDRKSNRGFAGANSASAICAQTFLACFSIGIADAACLQGTFEIAARFNPLSPRAARCSFVKFHALVLLIEVIERIV